jgi:hypothetical protein
MPISRATSSVDALSGGSIRATALFLNARPYLATLVLHRRPRIVVSIGATTILTRGASSAAPSQPALLPVTVVPEVPPVATPPTLVTPTVRAPSGTIEIEIGGARVRVRGNVDDTSLSLVTRT